VFDLNRHPLFRAWSDPISGITSHVLVERVAPVQYRLPSPSSGISRDERWLWFVCAHPPNQQRSLGLVCLDPAEPEIRHFPQAGFSGLAPQVTPEGDSVHFCAGSRVYRMNRHGQYSEVCRLGDDYLGGRHLWRLSSYCSPSPDGRYLLLDGLVGHHSFVAVGDLASGQVSIVREFQAHHGNAQFDPSDPQRVLVAQLPRRDPISGLHLEAVLRLHRMELDGANYHCLTPHIPSDRSHGISFEWWTDEGEVAYVDRETGVWTIDRETLRHRHRWSEPLCHADIHAGGRYLCADRDPLRWRDHPMGVLFYDSRHGRGIDIDSGMPTPVWPRREVAVAPMPRFSPLGTWISYTTTRNGGVDLALCPVRDLRDAVARLPALEAEREDDPASDAAPAREGTARTGTGDHGREL